MHRCSATNSTALMHIAHALVIPCLLMVAMFAIALHSCNVLIVAYYLTVVALEFSIPSSNRSDLAHSAALNTVVHICISNLRYP